MEDEDKKYLSELCPVSCNNYHEGKAVYILLMRGSMNWLLKVNYLQQKLPKGGYLKRFCHPFEKLEDTNQKQPRSKSPLKMKCLPKKMKSLPKKTNRLQKKQRRHKKKMV